MSNEQSSADTVITSKVLGGACAGCRNVQTIPPLSMAFQPIVDVHARRIVSHEALVRGVNGEGAAQMLKWAAGDTLYAFDQACRIKAIELAASLAMCNRLSINFLPGAVYQPRACIRSTLETAARVGFDTSMLTFEIVETENIADSSHLLDIIGHYREMGFKIALDDFGTGYSGLARLTTLKPDIIKVDRALVQDCDVKKDKLAILASLVSLGTQLDIEVVMEGVETAGEASALKDMGARLMQGYRFAKPAFERLVGEEAICWD